MLCTEIVSKRALWRPVDVTESWKTQQFLKTLYGHSCYLKYTLLPFSGFQVCLTSGMRYL